MTEPKRTVNYNYLPKQFPAVTSATWKGDSITHRILARIADVARRGDFTLGSEVELFEQAWSDVVEAQYAIGMSNGTDAIAIALQAAGMEPGDEVITSPFSFIATSGAILQAGGRPVFIDTASHLDPNIHPMNMDMPDAAWAVPVMWAGSPSGMVNWSLVKGTKVVVDAAQGMNALAGGDPLGAGDFYGVMVE